MQLPPLNLSSTPVSSASTGSDIFDKDFQADFGGVSVGGGGAGASWVSGLMRDLVVGAATALAVKFLWSKIK